MAGVRKAYFILRRGKWDIPAYFGDGSMLDMDLAYLMMRVPFGPPYTLDQAYPFVRNKTVAFGFPDILFDADDAFVKLLERQAATKADVVLGLFAVDQPWTMDMVVVENGAVRSIVIKPASTDLKWGWIIAVWTPVFTEFLHGHLINVSQGTDAPENRVVRTELTVGEVFQSALSSGLRMESVQFPKSSYLDIGRPENLIQAVYDKKFTEG
jgi:glucose-1-phosphate thymidylyltransferase